MSTDLPSLDGQGTTAAIVDRLLSERVEAQKLATQFTDAATRMRESEARYRSRTDRSLIAAVATVLLGAVSVVVAAVAFEDPATKAYIAAGLASVGGTAARLLSNAHRRYFNFTGYCASKAARFDMLAGVSLLTTTADAREKLALTLAEEKDQIVISPNRPGMVGKLGTIIQRVRLLGWMPKVFGISPTKVPLPAT